ncbi:MAG: hypothetical protein PHG02_02035 [Oscillospiraceae bacterium]|nr:hypothetical protein [Oscillospiraceae bacterium]
MTEQNNKKDKIIAIGCVAALLAACSFLLLLPGTMRSDDTMFHVIRLESLVEAIKMGDWAPHIFPYVYQNFGYAISLFYSDFFLYIPAVLCLLGVNSLTAYDLFFVLIMAASAFAAYYSTWRMFKSRIGSLVTTLLYVGSAYMATDVFSRSALGETQAFVFIPFALWGMYAAVLGDETRHWPLIVGFAGLVLSHNLSLMLTAVFFMFFLLFCVDKLIKQPKRILHIAYSAVFVAFSTAFFLFPMAEQLLKETFFSSYHARIFSPSTAAVRLRNLFISTDITPGAFFTPPVGITILAVLLLRIAFGFKLPQTTRERFRDLCILGGCFSLFMSTSFFPWGLFDPTLNIIQFPWRFHLFSTLFFAVAAGIMAQDLLKNKEKLRYAVWTVITVLCAIQFLSIAVPHYNQLAAKEDIVTNTADFIMWDENYLHGNNNRALWREREQHINEVRGVNSAVTAHQEVDYFVRTITYSENKTDNALECAIIYFLGYEAVDVDTGEVLPVSPSANGWLQIDIDTKQSGTIEVRYAGTAVQHIAPYITLAFFAVMTIWTLYATKKRKYKGFGKNCG